MTATDSRNRDFKTLRTDRHRTIKPKILCFGTPVALITTPSPDGTPNIGPMSSIWALG